MTTSVPVMVVCHKIAWSTTFTSWSCSRNFVAFNFVHCFDSFFFFVLLFPFSFFSFLCCWCRCFSCCRRWLLLLPAVGSSFFGAAGWLLVPLCCRLFFRFFRWTIAFANVLRFNKFSLLDGLVNVGVSLCDAGSCLGVHSF